LLKYLRKIPLPLAKKVWLQIIQITGIFFSQIHKRFVSPLAEWVPQLVPIFWEKYGSTKESKEKMNVVER
jgi:hypothetical protein